ncbi:MAG: LemA protein [Actinomycetota bacterium]
MTRDPLTISFFALLAFLALAALWIGSVYNKLVRLRNRADALWADIDVQLKRRHDLIPNLVAVVSGYATHERGTLDEVTQARNQAIAATSSAEQTQAENVLTGALGRLFANVERYPDLKAEASFQRLEEELAQLERVISMSRQAYNLTVQAYNNSVDTVPNAYVVCFMSFEDRPYLTAAESERTVPEVDMQMPSAPALR